MQIFLIRNICWIIYLISQKNLFFKSTLDVYGKIETIIDESSFITLTMYGWSKLYCEKLLENWSKRNNIILQILRIGHIYGKGEKAYKKVIPVTIQKLKMEKILRFFGYE